MTELPPEKPAKKKRKKPFSANALAIKECTRRGWPAMVVEQRIPHTFITRDLFNAIDIVAITPTGLLGIQVTSYANHASRRTKMLEERRMEQWTLAGGRLAVWSYKEILGGKRKEYELREENIEWRDFAASAVAA